MGCNKIKNGVLYSFTKKWGYVCFEHTTYRMELSRFGPSWFTVPGDKMIDPVHGGYMSVLWDIFKEWEGMPDEKIL